MVRATALHLWWNAKVMRTPFLLLALSGMPHTTGLQAQVADAGPDTTLCVNFYTMQGSPLPVGATGSWALVSGCGTIVNPGSPTTDLTSLCVGVNVFVWYVDDNGTITSDVVVITVFDVSMAAADAGPDTITVVAPQSSAFLSGSPIPIWPATCWWSWVQGSGVIVAPNDPNTSVGGLVVGDNILAWTCDNGPCGITSDTIVIQMMLATNVDEARPSNTAFAWDPQQRRLHYLGAGRISGLVLVDAQGKTLLLGRNVGKGPWHMPLLQPGIYLVRGAVDGRVVHHRFVVTD